MTNPFKIAYDKFRKGDPIDDDELKLIHRKLKETRDTLDDMPGYELATRAINQELVSLEQFAFHRGIFSQLKAFEKD